MKAEEFLRSMLPSFDRVRIKEDINKIREQLNNTTLEPYKQASEYLSNKDFKERFLKDWDDNCAKAKLPKYKNNYIVTIHSSLKVLNDKLDKIVDIIDKEYANDVTKESMTYLRLTLIQWVESANFVVNYSRRLLLVTYSILTSVAGKERLPDPKRDRNLRYLLNNEDAFWTALKALSVNSREDEKRLEKIPEIVVTEENAKSDRAMVGMHKLDPYGWGLISVNWNPIYHLRLAYVRYQIKNYKKALAEKEALELKLEHLKNKRSGKENAKLEKTIEYTEDRISELEYEIDKMEREADG